MLKDLDLKKADSCLFLIMEKTRRRILMILRNNRIMTITEFREIIIDEKLKAMVKSSKYEYGTSYPTIKHHFKLLEKAEMIVCNNKKEGLKNKGYTITEKGKTVIDVYTGAFKSPSQPYQGYSVPLIPPQGDRYG
jgi:DNA-binding transcriptional ArsR family regulator